MIKNGYDSKHKNYEPGGVVSGKIGKKWRNSWKRQLKRKTVALEQVEAYMAGMLIFDTHKMKQDTKYNK